MIKLRDYQKNCVEAILDGKKRGLSSMLVQAATGTGKTVILSEVYKKWPGKGSLLYLAHLSPLLKQTAKRLREYFPDQTIGIEKAEETADVNADVVVGSVQSIGLKNSRRLEDNQFSLICADEAHHAASPSNRGIYERLGVSLPGGPTLLGLTATPTRMDKKSLSEIFQEQVFSYPLLQAIRDEWLCDVQAFQARSSVNLDNVSPSDGDFNITELESAVNVPERTREAIRHWKEHGKGRPTVVFCVNIQHAADAAAVWSRQARVTIVHSKQTQEANAFAINRFKRGEAEVMFNVNALGEGWDFPPLSCIVMLRPTKSLTLYTQYLGRGTRGGPKCPVPGKKNLVLIDMADNCTRHSLISAPMTIGLPKNLDLKGVSLREAADLIEELGSRAAWADPPDNVTDLKTFLKEIDLFSGERVAPEVEEFSAFPWIKMLDGAYSIGCGKAMTENRYARDPDRMVSCRATLKEDMVGRWNLVLRVGTVKVLDKSFTGTTRDALERSDMTILRTWPNAEEHSFYAPWRYKQISEGQIKILRKNGVTPEELNRMNRGEASTRIDAIFARGKRR